MEGLCPCGHEPTGSIVPVSSLVSLNIPQTCGDFPGMLATPGF